MTTRTLAQLAIQRTRRAWSVELHAVGAWLVAPNLWLILVLSLLLWTLAYQQPTHYRLDFGGDRTTQRRYDDDPYLTNFNAPEPPDATWLTAPDPLPYRWTQTTSTIRLPGLGGGLWVVRMHAQGQPHHDLTTTTWNDGGTPITIPITRSPIPRTYHILAQARDGDLTLSMTTPPLDAPGDPRSLGFIAFDATFSPTSGARLPAITYLLMLAGVVALCDACLRRLGHSARSAASVSLGLIISITFLIANHRLALTVAVPILLPLIATCYGLLVIGVRLLPHLQQMSQHPIALDAQRNAIIGLIVLAFALRLGGMLHPHTHDSDIGLNVHNLAAPTQGVTTGEIYFTEALPGRAGGGQAPYPPGQYIILAPFQLLFTPSDAGRRLLLQIGNALIDSLVVGLLWYLLLRGGAGHRAALFGATLYLIAPPVLRSLSVGELANIFGQALALPILAALALVAHQLRDQRTWWTISALLTLALLGHLGVTIALALTLTCLGIVRLLTQRSTLLPLTLLVASASISAILLYYSAFLPLLNVPRALAPTATHVSLSLRLINQLNDHRGTQGLMVLLGLLGLGILRPRQSDTEPQKGLWLTLIAWWGAILLSFSLLIIANQSIRWQLFLAPLLCLGAGPTLAHLHKRGPTGTLLARTILIYLLIDGLTQWITQLQNYLH